MGVFFTAVHWNTSQLCFFEFFVGVFFTLEDITIVFFWVFCCCFLHYIYYYYQYAYKNLGCRQKGKDSFLYYLSHKNISLNFD